MDGTAATLSSCSADTDAPPGRVRRANVGSSREGENPPSRGRSGRRGRGAELSAELDEESFQGERRAQVELLEGPPGLAHEFTGPLGAGEAFGRGVLCEDGQAIGVDDGALRADGGDDEVAVPGRELFERREQLLPDGTLGKPREGNELAARANRLRQRPEVVRDEHDHRVGGGSSRSLSSASAASSFMVSAE